VPVSQMVPLHLIDEPPTAMRAAMDEHALDELMNSIRITGLLQPIGLIVVGDRYEIRFGHRRFIAVQRLGWPEIDARVYGPGEVCDEAAMLAENLHRADVSDGEVALWLAELQEKQHLTEAQLCALVKRSPDWVADRLRLFAGDKDVLQALLANRINFSVARELNKCKQEGLRKMYLAQAVESTPPARLVARWVTDANIQSIAAEPSPAPVQPIAENVAPTAPPVGCELCGGGLDPWNLRWHLMHEHEWQRLQDAIRNGAQG
jgi:ParB/RepB/Spo0J family partition protein